MEVPFSGRRNTQGLMRNALAAKSRELPRKRHCHLYCCTAIIGINHTAISLCTLKCYN